MKRFLIFATAVLLMLSMVSGAYAATATRRIEQTINALSKAPTTDGEINSGEYGDPIRVISKDADGFGSYYSLINGNAESEFADLPDKSTFYVNYDADYLYIAAEFETPSFTVNNTWFGGSHMLIAFSSNMSAIGENDPGINLPNRLLVWFNSSGALQTKIDKTEANVAALNQSVAGNVGASAAKVTEITDGNSKIGDKVAIELALKWDQIIPSGEDVPGKGDNFLLCLTYYEADGDGSPSRNTLISAAGTAARINHVSKHFKLILGDDVDQPALGNAVLSHSGAVDGTVSHLYINGTVPAASDDTVQYGIIFADSEDNARFAADGGNPLFSRVCKRYSALLESGCYPGTDGNAPVITAGIDGLGGEEGDDVIAVYWQNLPVNIFADGNIYYRIFSVDADGNIAYGEVSHAALGSEALTPLS